MENLFLAIVGWISDNRFWLMPLVLVFVLILVAIEIADAIRMAQVEIEDNS